jgi:hypothetical protein
MDIRSTGKLLNEYSADGSTFTGGGTGAIYREYARRTQADIQRLMKDWDPSFTPHPIGDPACLYDPAAFGPGEDTRIWGPGRAHGPAKGCTGLEQLVTSGEHTTPDGGGVDANVRKMSIGARAFNKLGYVSALKPGDPLVAFCVDPSPNPDGKDTGEACTADTECWSNSCAGADGAKKCDDVMKHYFQHCGGKKDNLGLTGAVLDASYNRVINYLAAGDVVKLPPPLRDRKYFFQQFGYAIVKYLLAAGNTPPPTNLGLPEFGPTGTACQGKRCEPEMDHLQFDQYGGTADMGKFEYIDRRWVEDGLEPLSFEYQILIVSGNQQESRFQRLLERDEETVFAAMSEDRSKPLGNPSDNIRLTNIIGSSLLATSFSGVSATKDAYFCATHDDAACKAGGGPLNSPPRIREKNALDVDDEGMPILTQYKGAFGETAFTLGTAHLKLVQEEPLIKSARVAVPIFDDPYSPGSGQTAAGPQVKITIPDWRPLAPGSGFRIPVNAQRDRFIPAAQVDFSGQNISLAINYELNDDRSMRILGVETQTWEGELFLCRDPTTQDFLHVRQYDSAAEILDWLENHPGARDACDILVRFSAFNEAPVSVTSKSAGLQVILGQGVGIGRVIDALLYDVTL